MIEWLSKFEELLSDKCPKISYTSLSYKMTHANSVDPDQTAPARVHPVCLSAYRIIVYLKKTNV